MADYEFYVEIEDKDIVGLDVFRQFYRADLSGESLRFEIQQWKKEEDKIIFNLRLSPFSYARLYPISYTTPEKIDYPPVQISIQIKILENILKMIKDSNPISVPQDLEIYDLLDKVEFRVYPNRVMLGLRIVRSDL